jgi:hypothetical protein
MAEGESWPQSCHSTSGRWLINSVSSLPHYPANYRTQRGQCALRATNCHSEISLVKHVNRQFHRKGLSVRDFPSADIAYWIVQRDNWTYSSLVPLQNCVTTVKNEAGQSTENSENNSLRYVSIFPRLYLSFLVPKPTSSTSPASSF